jgi:hypothetical protein
MTSVNARLLYSDAPLIPLPLLDTVLKEERRYRIES